MARTRNIKPSFFLNTELAELKPLARLLFAGLWCHADKSGRLEDNPKKIKALILPYDSCDVSELLDSLKGFITRYQVDGKCFIQIDNFEKHQNPHMREMPSTIPAPDKYGTSMVPNLPYTLTLNPQTLTPACNPLPVFSFEAIWKKYPNKDGRKAAEAHFKATVKTESDWSNINKALDNYLQSEKVRAGFIKNGSTWFNNWKDWINFTDKGMKVLLPKPDPEKIKRRDDELRELAEREMQRKILERKTVGVGNGQ